MKISVATGAGAAAAALWLEVQGLEDFRSLWPRIHRRWVDSRRSLFARGGAYDGGRRWRYTLAERRQYVAIKSSLTGLSYASTTQTVLRWPGSDRLMGSFIHTTDPHHVYSTTKDTATMGSSLPWAASNQFGGRAPKWLGGHRVPARDMLRIGPDLKESMERDAVDYIAEQIDLTEERVTAAAARAMRRRGQ